MPKFSIITVSKNPGPGICRTLESVKKQVFRDFEFLVVDGNSTDGSQTKYEEYNQIIDTFICEDDQGIYQAMNKGIIQAAGDYIMFLNSGDHFATDYSLFAADKHLQEGQLIDVMYGKVIWVDVFNKSIIATKHEHIHKKMDLAKDNYPHCASFYHREAFNKYGLFNEDLKVYADYEWNLNALLLHDAPFAYRDLIVSTFYTGGISTNESFADLRNLEKNMIIRKYFSKKVRGELNRIY